MSQTIDPNDIPTYGFAICGGCGEQIHAMTAGTQPEWAVYGDTVDPHTGAVISRVYFYDCHDEGYSHYPRADEPEPSEPSLVGHPDNEPVSAKTVRSAYANLVDGINRANTVLAERDRFCVPFAVQEALVRYIEEREAIESLTGDA